MGTAIYGHYYQNKKLRVKTYEEGEPLPSVDKSV